MAGTEVVRLDDHGRPRDAAGRFISRGALPAQLRDPKAATAQLNFVSPGQPQPNRWNAAQAIRRGYLESWVVARCVQLLAEAISSLPFRAGNQLPDHPMHSPAHNPRSRLATLLGPTPGGPAPTVTAKQLIYWTVVQRIVTGQHGWEIEWSGRPGSSEVAAFWPLTSGALRAVPTTGSRTVEWFDRFEYGQPHQPKRLTRDQVFYGWDPAPDDYRQPYSVLQSAALPVSVAIAVDRYQYAFLRNDARPATVVVTQEFGSDDEFEAFKRDWLARHQGPDKAGTAAFLEAQPDAAGQADATKAIHVEALGLTQKDARMLETHRGSMMATAAALGTPWSKIDASGRTFDNEAGEDRTWWQTTVVSMVKKLQEEINLRLAPLVGVEVGWFDLSQVEQLRPTPPVDAQGAAALVAGGVAAAEEVRPWFGLPAESVYELGRPASRPEPSGLPAADDEEDDRGARRGGGPEGGAPADGDDDLGGGAGDRPGSAGREPAGGASRHDPRSDPGPADEPVDHEARRAAIWARADATAQTLEGQWQRAFARLFRRQAESAIARLRGGNRSRRWEALAQARSTTSIVNGRGREVTFRDSVRDVFDPGFWVGETDEAAQALYEATFAAGAARVSDLFGISFNLAAPYAQTFISNRANQLAGQVTDTTYKAIRDALAEGVGAGESIDDLARRIRDVFDDAVGRRAEVIARTEVVSAFNGSASLAAGQLPADVVGGQEWIATRDGRTRPAHAASDGQVVPIGVPFTVSGQALAYPGDPAGSAANVVQCRCTVGFLTPAEVAALERAVPLGAARALLGTVRAGTEFDEAAFRRSLLEVTAA